MKTKFIIVLFLFTTIQALPQEETFEPSGKPFVTIYANFHRGITGSATDEAAFELVRGYLGYEYSFSPEWYAKINVDVGSPDDLSPVSKIRRYAYFKNAYLRYTQQKLEIEFGLIGLKQFKLQESVWERRYLMKTLADEYRLGSSADLGVNFHYAFSEKIDVDFTIMNGEGYSSLQMDDVFKYSLGSTFRFPRNFTSRIVYDIMRSEISETTLLLFSSYDFRSKWNIAGEFVIRQNEGWMANHDIYAFSVFGKYNLNERYQLFARFDKIKSNILEGETLPWHLANDGTALVAGIQFRPIKKITMALNYHDWYPWAANMEGGGFIFFDLEVKI
ncbi:porin [Mariniphaga sediminis]|uniref:porin n=1 Tax=Mariniphaga sediminis TaxID=1628158 RepID=UPI003567C934